MQNKNSNLSISEDRGSGRTSQSEIRIISLWQPWASLVALGLKQYETRSWGTNYRGKLAIHAAKRPIDELGMQLIADLRWKHQKEHGVSGHKSAFPLGCIVAIADLTECVRMTLLPSMSCPGLTSLELAVGDWREGRYAWKLENVHGLTEPIPFKGGQGLRRLEDVETLMAIAARIEATV